MTNQGAHLCIWSVLSYPIFMTAGRNNNCNNNNKNKRDNNNIILHAELSSLRGLSAALQQDTKGSIVGLFGRRLNDIKLHNDYNNNSERWAGGRDWQTINAPCAVLWFWKCFAVVAGKAFYNSLHSVSCARPGSGSVTRCSTLLTSCFTRSRVMSQPIRTRWLRNL